MTARAVGRVAVTLVVTALAANAFGALAPAGLAVLSGGRWVPPADAAVVAEPQDHQGEIFSFGITVPPETITVGDRITFPNNSDRPHTITDRGATFDTGEIAPGTSATVTFDTPGRVEIFCQINPSTMNAIVVVDPGDDPPARTRIQLYDEFREGETRRFDPADLTVDEGTEITVANVGGLEHTLTAEDGSFTTGTVTPGEEQGRFAGTSATLTADKSGTFTVFCEFFPDEMRGTLEVVAEEPPTTTTTEAPEDTAPDVAAPDEDGPPDGAEEDALLPGEDDSTDAGSIAAAAAVVVLGLGAIVVALTGKRPKKEPRLEAF
jgi:plastocyanin